MNKEIILDRFKEMEDNLAQQIKPMAGFRNILVHEYLKIDRKRVYEYTSKIEDFRKFERYILEFLERNKK